MSAHCFASRCNDLCKALYSLSWLVCVMSCGCCLQAVVVVAVVVLVSLQPHCTLASELHNQSPLMELPPLTPTHTHRWRLVCSSFSPSTPTSSSRRCSQAQAHGSPSSPSCPNQLCRTSQWWRHDERLGWHDRTGHGLWYWLCHRSSVRLPCGCSALLVTLQQRSLCCTLPAPSKTVLWAP